jgi:hypothetical protein
MPGCIREEELDMDREYTVRIGYDETHITLRQIGAASWLAQAKAPNSDMVESSGDDATYARERVKLDLQRKGGAELTAQQDSAQP